MMTALRAKKPPKKYYQNSIMLSEKGSLVSLIFQWTRPKMNLAQDVFMTSWILFEQLMFV